MRRRAFLAGGAVLALTSHLAAAQPGKVLRVGLLVVGPYDPKALLIAAFAERMEALGYTRGEGVVFEGRGGPAGRLPALAAELAALDLDMIVAWSSPAVAAAKERAGTTSIVMAGTADPVRLGFVESLARPGGNITGVAFQYGELIGKQVELLAAIAPGAPHVGILWDASAPIAAQFREAVAEVQHKTNLAFTFVDAPTSKDRANVFGRLKRDGAKGVLIMTTARHMNEAHSIADAALEAGLPAVFGHRGPVARGSGLVSYGIDWLEMARLAAGYVDRIARGAKPAELPVAMPTKFRLVVNLRTAKALGVTTPQSILLRADEVIQ